MKKRKSKFWLFIFSFVPGAGEMYMGLMKMGISLMLGFMLSIAVIAITNISVLSVIAITIYIYCFFHAHNIGSMDEADFQALEDTYLFGFDNLDQIRMKMSGKYRPAVAVVLIIMGVIMLANVGFNLLCEIFGWDNVYLSKIYYFVRDEVPRLLIGIAIIWGGITMLRGKKVKDAADKYIEINNDNNGKSNETE